MNETDHSRLRQRLLVSQSRDLCLRGPCVCGFQLHPVTVSGPALEPEEMVEWLDSQATNPASDGTALLSVLCGAVLGGHHVYAWEHPVPSVVSTGASLEESHVCLSAVPGFLGETPQ